MSLIEASSVGVKTMADGTLRLSVDIEPRFARDAFALFGSPGTPMALAALQSMPHEPETPKPKGGQIAQWLGIRCQEPEFQQWLADTFPLQHENAIGNTESQRAGSVIRAVCSVESRAELDSSQNAAKAFHDLIRKPYMAAKEQA